MEELGEIIKKKDVSLETKKDVSLVTKTTLLFPITKYKWENWTVSWQEKINSFWNMVLEKSSMDILDWQTEE